MLRKPSNEDSGLQRGGLESAIPEEVQRKLNDTYQSLRTIPQVKPIPQVESRRRTRGNAVEKRTT
jgi:Mn-dependent DtxR family transcriptional regulator